MRASVVAEKAGVPSVTEVCSAFVEQSRLIAKMLQAPCAPIAEYPGHIDTHSPEQRRKTIEEVVLPQIIKGLTETPHEAPGAEPSEPAPRDIVFSGTFEEVNAFFYQKQWSDGLPIVPPTIDKVEEFLRYTDRSPDEVLGVLPVANRQATVWNVAVNGVMAGCRPEYMPILLALVEIMADPRFSIKDSGATPGWESLIILDGPIVKQLGFNYKVGALRPGPMANTTIGRFWRLYVRNVPGFIPGVTDKGTWARNFDVVLAENMDALKEIGWEPLSVDQGFDAEDNVVTVQSTRARGYDAAIRGNTAKRNLDTLAYALVAFQANRLRQQIIENQSILLGLTPLNAGLIASAGYSKRQVRQYLWEHARVPAYVVEDFGDDGAPWSMRGDRGNDLCDAVRLGIIPPLYCESADPNRMVPVWQKPDQLKIVVSGDPGRNRAMITGSNVDYGLITSRKIEFPKTWDRLVSR